MTLGSDSETAMSSMRPPMLAGPIERKRKLRRSGSSDWLIGAAAGVAAGEGACPWADGRTAKPEIPSAAKASATEAPRVKRLEGTIIKACSPENRRLHPADYDPYRAGAYRRRQSRSTRMGLIRTARHAWGATAAATTTTSAAAVTAVNPGSGVGSSYTSARATRDAIAAPATPGRDPQARRPTSVAGAATPGGGRSSSASSAL